MNTQLEFLMQSTRPSSTHAS